MDTKIKAQLRIIVSNAVKEAWSAGVNKKTSQSAQRKANKAIESLDTLVS